MFVSVYVISALLTSSFVPCKFANGFPRGPPRSVVTCIAMKPAGHFPQVSQPLGYVIATDKDWFDPGEVLTINISSPLQSNTFRGLMMQVRDSTHKFCGSFSEPAERSGFKLLRCETLQGFTDRSANSTVSHADRTDKSLASFQWKAPLTCEGTNYTINATVVRGYTEYQMNVVKHLSCTRVETPTEPEVTSRCQYANLTLLPENKYRTSFENDRDTNGWSNVGWTINFGRTRSTFTGPESAADGRFYMYFETSHPVRTGGIAYLSTDEDLRGCLCLKLKHSHNVAVGLEHKLTITAGSDILYQTMSKNRNWKQLRIQIDAEHVFRIWIVGTKGIDFRGDMAVDDIEIVQGWCSDDEEGSK